jgi:hypothetical protein
MYKRIGSAALLLALWAQPTAFAQTTTPPERPPRIWISINGASTTGEQQFGVASTFSLYEEQGSFEASQAMSKGATADGAVLVRVWENLFGGGVLAGVGYSGLNSRSAGSFSLQVPHPLAYERARAATGQVESLDHREEALNLILAWSWPVMDRLDVTAMLGPTFFTVKQKFVSGIRYSEVPPTFDSVTVDEVTTSSLSESAPGFMIGADVAYMFTRWVGAGFFARYNAGTLKVTTPGGEPFEMDLGGFQWGGGVRLRVW